MSLLLCIAMAALWVRSHFRAECLTWVLRETSTQVHIVDAVSMGGACVGEVCWINAEERPVVGLPPSGFGHEEQRFDPVTHKFNLRREAGWYWAGFGFASSDASRSKTMHGYAILLPHWFLVLLTAFLPLLWTRRHYCQRRREYRRKSNLCL